MNSRKGGLYDCGSHHRLPDQNHDTTYLSNGYASGVLKVVATRMSANAGQFRRSPAEDAPKIVWIRDTDFVVCPSLNGTPRVGGIGRKKACQEEMGRGWRVGARGLPTFVAPSVSDNRGCRPTHPRARFSNPRTPFRRTPHPQATSSRRSLGQRPDVPLRRTLQNCLKRPHSDLRHG